jgi:hypothetical protein
VCAKRCIFLECMACSLFVGGTAGVCSISGYGMVSGYVAM